MKLYGSRSDDDTDNVRMLSVILPNTTTKLFSRSSWCGLEASKSVARINYRHTSDNGSTIFLFKSLCNNDLVVRIKISISITQDIWIAQKI